MLGSFHLKVQITLSKFIANSFLHNSAWVLLLYKYNTHNYHKKQGRMWKFNEFCKYSYKRTPNNITDLSKILAFLVKIEQKNNQIQKPTGFDFWCQGVRADLERSEAGACNSVHDRRWRIETLTLDLFRFSEARRRRGRERERTRPLPRSVKKKGGLEGPEWA